jgi:hypothetical protein
VLSRGEEPGAKTFSFADYFTEAEAAKEVRVT